MTHLSLFSGIGGFDLGFELAGIETVAQVENNAFCLEVLRTHWPEVPKHEDIREFDGREYRGVNVVSGGFPCQGLSVAGRREGLSDPRSGLFFEMCRVVEEADPEFVVWENVCGLLSSAGGRDFATVLGTLADLGYDGVWRVLDSEWFGVAQRRRRVFGVFARGDVGWRSAAAVLLEPEGGGWNPPQGRKTGKDISYCLSANARGGSTGGWRNSCEDTFIPEIAAPLEAADGQKWGSQQWVDRGCALVVGTRSATHADRSRASTGLPVGLDSARYRALGNAVTVNVAYWIGLRLKAVAG